MIDHATGLSWQQSGSPETIPFEKVEAYIGQLNRETFAGYSDWRLPTLEEAMSLMEPKRENDLFIDPVFDRTQSWIWTSDKYSASRAWSVYFVDGYCDVSLVDFNYYVRAVR